MAKIPSYEALTRICQQARRRAAREGTQTVIVALTGDRFGHAILSAGEEVEVDPSAYSAQITVDRDSDCLELARTLRDRLRTRKGSTPKRTANGSRAYRNPYASLFDTRPSDGGVVTVSDFTTYTLPPAAPRRYVRRAHRNPYETPRRLRR
jgi:hypothetical protein